MAQRGARVRAAPAAPGGLERLVASGTLEGVALDVLKTVAYVADAPPDAFGAYVISQATSAADVLAVELLLHEAGCGPGRSNCARVVPSSRPSTT